MRKQQIERAALRLFAEKGITAVSIRDIAEAVGIVESGIYRHIRSKEELAIRVFREAYAEFSGKIREAMAGSSRFPDQVDAIVSTIYAAFDEDPVLLRFLVLRQHDAIPAANLGDDNPVLVVRETVDAAVGAGVVPQMETEVALAILMGIILQPLTNALYGRITLPILHLAPVMSGAVLRALQVEEV